MKKYELTQKEEKLFSYIQSFSKDKVAIAFSGGVDSSLVLKIAREVSKKEDVLAITFDTLLNPKKDIHIVKDLVKEFDVNFEIIQKNYIDNEKILNNDIQRCYYCKKDIFEQAISLKNSLGFKHIFDGSNFDDVNIYRPGKKALEELNVISPLKDMEFTKKEIRQLAKKLNITVASRPSKPCMMTRFPYNTRVDMSKFNNLEQAEDYLSFLGFSNNRVRLYDTCTRIEVEIEKFPLFFAKREDIIKKFKELGFSYINLDMEGFRSGSMDIFV